MLTWIAAILLFLTFLLLCWLGKEKKSEPETVNLNPPPKEGSIHLGQLSQVWTGKEKERVIKLADLSKNWRKEPAVKESEPVREKPVFSHHEIGAFYHTWVDGKPNMTDIVLLSVEELLKLLDREGDCPSVVNLNSNEVESKLEGDVYTLLAKLPLYRHSLNVAEELASRCSQKLLAPMSVITGLAHDLGKLPSHQDLFYKTGDHPFIAPIILDAMESFKKLNYAQDVMEAIRQHHRPQPETDLGKRLKDADQACRNHEIAFLLERKRADLATKEEAAVNQTAKGEPPESATDSGEKTDAPILSEFTPSPEESPDKGAERKTIEAQVAVFGGYLDQDPDIFGATAGKEGKIENTLVEIEWFDPTATLAYLKQFINRIKGGRFHAFSMPDGIVYVRVSYFWQAAKRLSRNHPRLLAADADIQARRDIMFSMVERLKESKAIATDLLGPGFFMAVFVINPDSEEPREESLIPFRAEAFGEPVSILEARKVHRIKEIRQVVAKHLLERKESIFG
jgi:hypothetical protein